MSTNRNHDSFDDDLDALEDDIELDPFLDAMAVENTRRQKSSSPRRAIEALKEKQRLKKLLEDYPDFD